MTDKLIRKGQRGEGVSSLQQKLNQLGYAVKTDGIFGDETEKAVREVQTMFGYDVDGIVGPGTSFLLDQQIGLGWNKNAPDAYEKAQSAQGKSAGGKGTTQPIKNVAGGKMDGGMQKQPMPGGDGSQKWGKDGGQQQPGKQPQMEGQGGMPPGKQQQPQQPGQPQGKPTQKKI